MKTNPIKVGSYEVIRKGSRIVVQTPSYLNRWHINPETETYSYEAKLEPAKTEVAFTQERAIEALKLPSLLVAQGRKSKKAKAAVKSAVKTVMAAQRALDEARRIARKTPKEIFVHGYQVLPSKGGGIRFGCTRVTKENLKAISKLVKEKQ